MQDGTANALAFTAADLFAGGGGLTVGLKRAGFHVVAAVEIERHAFATYKANHPEVRAYKQDIRTVSALGITCASPTGEIDLLAGCPPCQGFTSLTSKYRREDERNGLIAEMARLIAEVRPRAVMMENVPGLAIKGKPLLDAFLDNLRDLGYLPNWKILQVADYGVPQSRRRLVLLAGKGFRIDLPEPSHSRKGNNQRKPWRTLREALSALADTKAITFAEARELGGADKVNWHVVRTLSERNAARLKVIKPGTSWRDIPVELRPYCHWDVNTGFPNVYGRMTWEQLPVAITSGFATLSKGRFGHPNEDRTISVREAALIQTFPIDYIFDTPYMEYACQIIGNALPCDFAEIVARQCYRAMLEQRKTSG